MKWFNKVFLMMLSAAIVFVTGCKKDNNNNNGSGGTFYGANQALGNGTIRSFVILDAKGIPQTIGMKFTEGALSGLPSDSTAEHDTPVELPSQAKITGFDHLEVDWNPVGHEPKAIYGLPHFDFHFYMISKAEQQSVIPGPDTASVPAAFIPQDYQSGVIAVPDMGVHWVDVKAPEFNGQKFTDTYIYGFYHGKMTFVEPMITAEFLSSKPDFKINIKQPTDFQKSGYYPAVQHIQYDPNAKEYTMALEGLKYYTGKGSTN